jgi:hypothetical protein
MPRPQPTPNRRGIVTAIPKYAIWPLPRAPMFALQPGNRIDQPQGFLRVGPIRAGQANSERHAPAVADQMALAPALGPISRIGPGLITPVHRADGTTVDDLPRPINLVAAGEPIQHRKVDQVPHARQLPIAQPPPSRHPRSQLKFLRKHLPGSAAAKNEDNAGQARAIRDARPPTFWPSGWNRQERFDKMPQRIWKQRSGHTRYATERGPGFGGFVTRS